VRKGERVLPSYLWKEGEKGRHDGIADAASMDLCKHGLFYVI
jgi:hypothetical protein